MSAHLTKRVFQAVYRPSLTAILITISSTALFAGREYPLAPGETAIGNRLVVKFTHRTSPEAAIRSVAPGAMVSPVIAEEDVYRIDLPNHGEVKEAIFESVQAPSEHSVSLRLAERDDVVYVEPDRVRRTEGITPNDPQLSSQWALQMINAAAGWGTAPNYFLTASQVSSGRTKLAVLDTGADCTHPDFVNEGGNSTDAASGGQLMFSLSNAYYATTIQQPACPWQDDVGHGTHVAGILAASANNGLGVAGLGYPIQLIVYKVLFPVNGVGMGADSVIAQAIVAAANNGAAVISMSLSGAGYSPTLQIAINYAWAKNVLVVAAAGNSGSSALNYPGGANYAMGVSATDCNDAFANFSSFGPQVHIAAPGVNILSTLPGASYGSLSGTSMATPFVSGLAGMLAMASPNTSAAAIAMRIEQSADNNNAGGIADQFLGYGRINVAKAISGPMRPTSQGGVTGQVVDAGTALPLVGITLSLAGQSFVTNSTGLFRFYGIPAGQYTLAASGGVYSAISRQLNIVAGADTTFTVAMGGSPAEITGTVTDNGVPVVGGIVQSVSAGLVTATAVTGANGQFFLYVQPSIVTVTASAIYHITTSSAPQTIIAGTTTTLSLSLPAMGQISGNVTLSNGAPATDAVISVSGVPMSTSAAIDGGGNFTTIGLSQGNYTLTASLPGLPAMTTSAVVATDRVVTTSLQFPNNGQNALFAAISAKTGVANARIWTISFQNNGSQTANAVTVAALNLVQQGGPSCAPVVISSFPAVIGSVGPGATVAGTATIDFSSCTTAARFKATVLFTANSQAIAGTLTLNNQFQ